MLKTLRNWFRKNEDVRTSVPCSARWLPSAELSTHPHSKPYPLDPSSLRYLDNEFLPPPGTDPRHLFPMLRRLRDYVPDVSAGVWAWVRLCSTAQSYTLSEGPESEQGRARALLDDLDRRIGGYQAGQERGVESLVQAFFTSVFTYGSFCGEVVLHESRRGIERFVIVDPATVRFRLDETRRLHVPFQIQTDGSLLPLNRSSFFYYGLDTDGLSPYGRSPLLALPMVIRLQQQLLSDMTRAQHNAGYPTIHFKLRSVEPGLGERPNNYNERVEQEMSRMREELRRKESDSNLVTLDNVEVKYIGPNGNSLQWSESLQSIGEQVISALHLAPFMIGRNWGTTQTWGTAQYHLLTNNARTVQEGAKRLAEWLRNLELILQDSPLTVTHHFAPHHHLDVLDRARAFRTSAETLALLAEKGLVEVNIAKQRIENLLRFV